MKKIGVIATSSDKAQNLMAEIIHRYNFIDVKNQPQEKIEALIVLGGDGFMLRTIHKYLNNRIPIYGINCGSVGFLLNKYNSNEDLIHTLVNAYPVTISPLRIKATDCNYAIYNTIAVNEISIFRKTYQAAIIEVKINNTTRIKTLVGDGLLVSTSVGSSAYNFSAGGPILPINSKLLSLTGINTFRPRRWKSALIPDTVKIELRIIDAESRPVVVAADYNEFCDIEKIEITTDIQSTIQLLFNSQNIFDEKVITEQFIN